MVCIVLNNLKYQNQGNKGKNLTTIDSVQYELHWN